MFSNSVFAERNFNDIGTFASKFNTN